MLASVNTGGSAACPARRCRRTFARWRVSRSRAAVIARGSMVQMVSASSNCGALARIWPSWSIARLWPSKTSSSWPPTVFTKTTAVRLSTARWISMRSRPAPTPRRYGEADRFRITCAPASASVIAGGPGSQMSSQMLSPIGTPFSSTIAASAPDWK